MRILVISNFYPPHKIGGYELLCEEVVGRLVQNGHQVRILTSTYGVGVPVVEGNVYREFELENDLHFYSVMHSLTYPLSRSRNASILRERLFEYQPDVVFIWGMWALSKNIIEEAERLMGGRVVYYFANPWPIQPSLHQTYWDEPAASVLGNLLKSVLRYFFRVYLNSEWQPTCLKYQYSPICSQAQKEQLLEAGIPLQDAPVIYEGINLPAYLEQAENRTFTQIDSKISLLYVGILAPHKGVHTAIEALSDLSSVEQERFQLTILGTGLPTYEKKLRSMVQEFHLGEVVSFHEPIPRENLPEFLGQHDVLLLTSIWEEPLALIMQEGLASGMVVIGTSTGGTKEIIVDNENGLRFEADDHAALARLLQRISLDSTLLPRLSNAGRQTAAEKFDIVRMVDEIEAYLHKVIVTENAPDFSH